VVKFDSRGGSAVGSHHVEHGSKTTEPKDPTRANFNFDGWYKDSLYTATAEWDFDVDVVNAPTTLYAKWTTLVVRVVTFNAQGGSALSPQHVENGKTAVEHPSALAGYTLEGWYKEAAYTTKWNFASPVTADMTLYARWTPIPYTITYVLDGGTATPANTQSYNITTAVFTLVNPTKKGYTFLGWTGANGDVQDLKVVVPTGSTGSKTYTANWSLNTYTITYDYNGGDIPEPTPPLIYNPPTYTVLSAAITLTNPTRTGWTFAGWTETNDAEPNMVGYIAAGDTGSKSFTATWNFLPTFIDERDNNREYRKVLIGTQVWMGENLVYAGNNPESPIGVCYQGLEENCALYEGLYYSQPESRNSAAASTAIPSGVQGACPAGWHLPSQGEVNILFTFIGGTSAQLTSKLKAENDRWTTQGTDDYGFSALPGGHSNAFNNPMGWRAIDGAYFWHAGGASWYIQNAGAAANNPIGTTSGANTARAQIRCVQD
jgi:uncharacterized protein (TIGR02145 family)/uncharacterized repeat protein (TIGR02543 family)